MSLDGAILAHEAAPAPAPKGAPRPWWETRWFVAAMILLAFVPLLYPQVPPLVDLPGHMGRYRVELGLASSADLQRFYTFEWRPIGNLGLDLLVVPLSKLFGLELSVKLIALSIPPLTVAGFLWVAREVHNRLPPTVAFALPFAFSHPFLYGFANYMLATALAFLAFGLWLRLGRLEKLRLRALLFVPISFILYICHTFGWGTLGLLAFSAEAVRQHDKGLSWWKAGLAAIPHAAVMAGPLLMMFAWRGSTGAGLTQDWFNFPAKSFWMLMALRDRWRWFDMALIAFALFLITEAVRRRELNFSRNLAFSTIVLFAVYLLMPRIIFGSSYADMRLAPFILATAILAIRFKGETHPVVARQLAIAGTAFYVLKVAATTASLGIAAKDQTDSLEALDHVPRGATVASLIGDTCGMPWALPRNSHLGGLAIVRRDAFVNDQWAVAGANLLGVHYRAARPFMVDPSQLIRPNGCGNFERREVDQALRAIPRDAFDYVWTIALPPHDEALLAGYAPIWAKGSSKLYRNERLRPVGAVRSLRPAQDPALSPQQSAQDR